MPFDILLFDLDGTLYDQANGYEDHIHNNIFKFMVEAKGGKFDKITTIDEAKHYWAPIFAKYNLTKRGLLGEGYELDIEEYDRFIRQGASNFIKKDPELREFLLSLPQKRKIIFTNAPEESAHEILNLLGVSDLFEAVLGTSFLDHKICKPEPEAFEKVMNHIGVAESDYHKLCFFEDSFKNLAAGKKLGLGTVFVSSSTLTAEGRSTNDLVQFQAVIESKVGMGLKKLLPELWDRD
jgi:putative hydrolase of the HAD superfamily